LAPSGTRVTELPVPDALVGERVDRALATLTGWSRAEIGRLCDAGDVLVGGRAAVKSRRVASGDVIELLAEPEPAVAPGPDPGVAVEVRHADEDVIVVEKPAGLVMHPGAGHPGGTLVNGLLARFPDLAEVGDPGRPGLVHRLDRDTSGLLVVARSPRAYDALVEELSRREVERGYVALVWGHLDAPRGVIDAPIGRSQARRTRMAVRESGRDARTSYEVVRQFDAPDTSLLACRLETGRTHQIRVHLAAIGHPVVGDAAYRGSRTAIPLARPFLHAATLAFRHPATGETMRFEEPLPDELASVLSQLD
jgi:23S rRNA pseudouridine1911/1915/1917 synthase